MGSLSSLFLISGRHYRERLVPAFTRLAETGEWPNWILESHAEKDWTPLLSACDGYSEDLLEVLTSPTLCSDLSINPAILHREILGCPPEFHGVSQTYAPEAVRVAFAPLLLAECGVIGVSFGREHIGHLAEMLLEAYSFESSASAHLLLLKLGNSMMSFNDGTGGSLEGVCGRLNTEDSGLLSRALVAFQHPALTSATRDGPALMTAFSAISNWEMDDGIPESGALSVIQALGCLANHLQCDLAWINDPVVDCFEHDGVFWRRLAPLAPLS